MNTYDFDKTIYRRDSSTDFWLYCFRRFPHLLLPILPGCLTAAVRYLFGRIDTKALKEQLFSFLPGLDSEKTAEEFWQKHYDGIGAWYLAQKRPDDLILSASPEFLLAPVTRTLGVRLIATPMDPATGRIHGRNCHDQEKVRRFFDLMPGAHSECFYSDSLSDSPMAEIAEKAYLVKNGRLRPWPEHDRTEVRK